MKTKGLGVLIFLLLLAGVCAAAESVELVSDTGRGSTRGGSPTVSRDGKWVAFNGNYKLEGLQIIVRNLDTDYLEVVSVASDGSTGGYTATIDDIALSADGRFVVFESLNNHLVAGDDNGTFDLFLRDRLAGTTEAITLTADGRFSSLPNAGFFHARISADGRFVVFESDAILVPGVTRGSNIYLWDRLSKTNRLVAKGLSPALSDDGRYLAYRTGSGVQLLDLQTRNSELIVRKGYRPLPVTPYAYIPSISADGRYVVYEGGASLTAPLSTEVFVYDRLTRTTRQITWAYDGNPLTTASGDYLAPLKPRISGNGRYVVFFSSAADLVQGVDGNQLYLYDLVSATMRRLPIDNLYATVVSPWFDISGDGARVVFHDTASNHLTKGDNAFATFVVNTGIVRDGNGNCAGSLKIVTEPAVLWPPTGKLTTVSLAVTAPDASRVEIRIEDEYGVGSQTLHGSGGTVQLEAWRAGDDEDGRIYAVTAVAFDAYGNETTATTTVTVPHDQH